IRRGLEQAVRRGSLLSAQVGPAEGPERVFLLNTEANRRALPSLAGLVATGAGVYIALCHVMGSQEGRRLWKELRGKLEGRHPASS
ncbi:MAG: hypothetical protein ACE5ID_12335, partial [Acidobacteriota bacterium]